MEKLIELPESGNIEITSVRFVLRCRRCQRVFAKNANVVGNTVTMPKGWRICTECMQSYLSQTSEGSMDSVEDKEGDK